MQGSTAPFTFLHSLGRPPAALLSALCRGRPTLDALIRNTLSVLVRTTIRQLPAFFRRNCMRQLGQLRPLRIQVAPVSLRSQRPSLIHPSSFITPNPFRCASPRCVRHAKMPACPVSASHPKKRQNSATAWPPATSAKPISKNASSLPAAPAARTSTKPPHASCSATPPPASKSKCKRLARRPSTGSTPDADCANSSRPKPSAKKVPKPSNKKKSENKKPAAKDAAGQFHPNDLDSPEGRLRRSRPWSNTGYGRSGLPLLPDQPNLRHLASSS